MAPHEDEEDPRTFSEQEEKPRQTKAQVTGFTS